MVCTYSDNFRCKSESDVRDVCGGWVTTDACYCQSLHHCNVDGVHDSWATRHNRCWGVYKTTNNIQEIEKKLYYLKVLWDLTDQSLRSWSHTCLAVLRSQLRCTWNSSRLPGRWRSRCCQHWDRKRDRWRQSLQCCRLQWEWWNRVQWVAQSDWSSRTGSPLDL